MRYDNRAAISLYEKSDFRQFGEHRDYYADAAMAPRYEKVLVPRPQPQDRGPPAALAPRATPREMRPPPVASVMEVR